MLIHDSHNVSLHIVFRHYLSDLVKETLFPKLPGVNEEGAREEGRSRT